MMLMLKKCNMYVFFPLASLARIRILRKRQQEEKCSIYYQKIWVVLKSNVSNIFVAAWPAHLVVWGSCMRCSPCAFTVNADKWALKDPPNVEYYEKALKKNDILHKKEKSTFHKKMIISSCGDRLWIG